jgi:2'-5' RNA ligase
VSVVSQAATKRLRLFVACDLPPQVEGAVAAWQRSELAPHGDLRLTRSLHLTLAFLGDVGANRVPELRRILADIGWRPARCRFGDPLFLPAHGRRRVVALHLEDASDTLLRLQADVAAGLAAADLYKPEGRPWLPHVTVARFRRPGHPFSLQNVNIGWFGVVRMVLYSSDLEPGGALHSPLADYPAS